MGEPNCHTASRISVQMAVRGLPSHTTSVPKTALISPLAPKISRHMTATATLPPTMDGA